MVSVKVEELQASIDLYLGHLHAGEEVVITEHGHPVARLVPYGQPPAVDAEDQGVGEARILRQPERELPPDFLSQSKALDPKGLFRRAVLEEREQNW
jgi:antitoxin (DNA-binding transcriptional repressor) of toxin-antitoxin stability system